MQQEKAAKTDDKEWKGDKPEPRRPGGKTKRGALKKTVKKGARAK